MIPRHLGKPHSHHAAIEESGVEQACADHYREDSPASIERDGQDRGEQDQGAGDHPHLAIDRDRFFATDHGQAGLGPGHRATFDIDHVRQTRAQEALASLRASSARTADHVEGLFRLGIESQGGRVESIQRDIFRDIDVDLLELGRGADIDQVDRVALGDQIVEGFWGDGLSGHGAFRGERSSDQSGRVGWLGFFAEAGFDALKDIFQVGLDDLVEDISPFASA